MSKRSRGVEKGMKLPRRNVWAKEGGRWWKKDKLCSHARMHLQRDSAISGRCGGQQEQGKLSLDTAYSETLTTRGGMVRKRAGYQRVKA